MIITRKIYGGIASPEDIYFEIEEMENGNVKSTSWIGVCNYTSGDKTVYYPEGLSFDDCLMEIVNDNSHIEGYCDVVITIGRRKYSVYSYRRLLEFGTV